jgi:hypothetical protein
MAQRTRTELVDDIDGRVLRDGKGETVSFALDGSSYEIDLSTSNARKFRSIFEGYVSAGRKVTGARTRRRSRAAAPSRAHDPRAVREWAAANGLEISARGRIPAEILEQYRTAGN